MSTDETCFEAARILTCLRISPSELGYRAQALLAEALSGMGARIDAVMRAGHPDVLAHLAGRTLRMQSKATVQSTFTLSAADLEGIRPKARDEDGYLALLDLGPPVAWVCVPYADARVLVGRAVSIAMLKAMDDAPFSARCTNAFARLVVENKTTFEAYTFSLVRKRVLTDE